MQFSKKLAKTHRKTEVFNQTKCNTLSTDLYSKGLDRTTAKYLVQLKIKCYELENEIEQLENGTRPTQFMSKKERQIAKSQGI